MSVVKRTERGWGAHYMLSNRCRFRRNTLLELGDDRRIVSTVGWMWNEREAKWETIGHERYYETIVWRACIDQDSDSLRWGMWVADIGHGELDADTLGWRQTFVDAEQMHENMVTKTTIEMIEETK